jgi:UDP-glucuronate 4-epimerase
VSRKILVTGTAGFIGYHLVRRLLSDGWDVVGIDDLNPSCGGESLKKRRLAELEGVSGTAGQFAFSRTDICDREALFRLIAKESGTEPFACVCHLAARAGVRESLMNPELYGRVNMMGFLNVLDACRVFAPASLAYASSSSVYGYRENETLLREDMPTDRQESLYGATKKSNEIPAASYSSTFGLYTAGMRFFSVYGPWGRPDSVLWHFCRNITEGRPVKIFGDGTQKRDFTFVSDVVDGILAVLSRRTDSSIPGRDRSACFNIGRGEPVSVLRLLECTERALGMRAVSEYLPPQPGDIPFSGADIGKAALLGYSPKVSPEDGVRVFAEWFRSTGKYIVEGA